MNDINIMPILGALKTLQIKEIVFNPVQPKGRTEKAKLTSIRQSIRRVGGLLYPPTIAWVKSTKNYVAIDGMRRLTACTEEGYNYVPCLVVPVETVEEAERLFIEANGHTMGHRGKQLIFSLATSTDPRIREALPASTKSNVDALVEIFGIRFEEFAKAGAISTAIPDIIRCLNRALVAAELEELDAHTCGVWLVTNKGTVIAGDVLRSKNLKLLLRLRDCIISGEKFVYGE